MAIFRLFGFFAYFTLLIFFLKGQQVKLNDIET